MAVILSRPDGTITVTGQCRRAIEDPPGVHQPQPQSGFGGEETELSELTNKPHFVPVARTWSFTQFD